ncbi:hypothetical protein NMY22_g7975 [Coprinellus aureogranulatus]|nr:hypothetical protein NMY22_g7975 [Coprinellus aureogranulatus]
MRRDPRATSFLHAIHAMPSTHSEPSPNGNSNSSRSYTHASEATALKKQIAQLKDEIEELKRDKRSFRDASDELRWSLVKAREELKEVKRRFEVERLEKERLEELNSVSVSTSTPPASLVEGTNAAEHGVQLEGAEKYRPPFVDTANPPSSKSLVQPDGSSTKRKLSENQVPLPSKKARSSSTDTASSSSIEAATTASASSSTSTNTPQLPPALPHRPATHTSRRSSSSESVADPRLAAKQAQSANNASRLDLSPTLYSIPVIPSTREGHDTGTKDRDSRRRAREEAPSTFGALETYAFGQPSLLDRVSMNSQSNGTRPTSPNKKCHTRTEPNGRNVSRTRYPLVLQVRSGRGHVEKSVYLPLPFNLEVPDPGPAPRIPESLLHRRTGTQNVNVVRRTIEEVQMDIRIIGCTMTLSLPTSMSASLPASAKASCSCSASSENEALKKRVDRLAEEVEELRRDKRSFRDASDEARRTLARTREELVYLRKKVDAEKEEKEKVMARLKEVQAGVSVAKPTSGSDAVVHHTTARNTHVEAPNAYPSPVEPDRALQREEERHGEDTIQASSTALGKRKIPEDAVYPNKKTSLDVSESVQPSPRPIAPVSALEIRHRQAAMSVSSLSAAAAYASPPPSADPRRRSWTGAPSLATSPPPLPSRIEANDSRRSPNSTVPDPRRRVMTPAACEAEPRFPSRPALVTSVPTITKSSQSPVLPPPSALRPSPPFANAASPPLRVEDPRTRSTQARGSGPSMPTMGVEARIPTPVSEVAPAPPSIIEIEDSEDELLDEDRELDYMTDMEPVRGDVRSVRQLNLQTGIKEDREGGIREDLEAVRIQNTTVLCSNASKVEALTKCVEELTEENDELKRDKRFFRDVSDEWRRSLEKLRGEVEDLREKLEVERVEKEKALGLVRELQGAKGVSYPQPSPAAQRKSTDPSVTAEVSQETLLKPYPSPIELSVHNDLVQPSVTALGKRKFLEDAEDGQHNKKTNTDFRGAQMVPSHLPLGPPTSPTTKFSSTANFPLPPVESGHSGSQTTTAKAPSESSISAINNATPSLDTTIELGPLLRKGGASAAVDKAHSASKRAKPPASQSRPSKKSKGPASSSDHTTANGVPSRNRSAKGKGGAKRTNRFGEPSSLGLPPASQASGPSQHPQVPTHFDAPPPPKTKAPNSAPRSQPSQAATQAKKKNRGRKRGNRQQDDGPGQPPPGQPGPSHRRSHVPLPDQRTSFQQHSMAMPPPGHNMWTPPSFPPPPPEKRRHY